MRKTKLYLLCGIHIPCPVTPKLHVSVILILLFHAYVPFVVYGAGTVCVSRGERKRKREGF